MISKKTLFNIKRVALIFGIIVIPLLYSYFYLGAFLDPYGNLNSMPVAIVNEDTGATINGVPRNLGNEMVSDLKSDMTLKWIFTNETDAHNGVDGSKYYASITIPSNFSTEVASAGTTDKHVADLNYYVNEKHNYIAVQILSKVTLTLEQQTERKIDKDITSQLVLKLKQTPDKLVDLSNGLNDLYSGSTDLTTGINTAANGSNSVKSGAISLNNGLIQLNTGLSTLTGSINDFNSGLDKTRDGSKLLAQGATQLPALNNGITQLDQGAKQLNTGINQYITGVNSMMTTLSSAPSYGNVVSELKAEYTSELPYYDYMTNAQKAQITQLGSLVALLSGDPTAVAANNQNQQSLINGAAAISGGADSLYAQEGNITALHDGILSLDSALGLLQDGSAKIYTGAQQLQSGAADAKAGSAQLADGSSQLNNGLSQLQSGASQLSNGIKSAQSGVSSSVNDANSQIAALNGLDSYVANPVDIKETNIDPVPNYGTAFAPYFLSLSLWVGALIMFVGIFLDPNEKIKVLSRHSQRRFTRIGVFALLGITQAFALGLVVQFALHIKIDNIFAYYLSACLISMAFISIVEFCIVNLDDVGKFLAMAFLVIQLTSCGGTFPMETVPAFFQKIYPFMPMTYSVRLFKDTISGFDGGDASHDIFVLVMIFVCFNLLNILFSITKRARVKNKQKAVEAAEANA